MREVDYHRVKKREVSSVIKEAHALFLKETNLEVGFSSFKALRQQEVFLVSRQGQEVSKCIYCDNFEAIVIGFQKVGALP
ncbi:hypothetical protein QYM36_014607 [Artemia franciscana]|uniref:Uncharacterized protein n=1 Tax=Artemia franciscana TaxID=6661 RepID=A0AA88L0P3_ARTSF|nr:hypothetical protein QYM36_014607 [Artemia franciscana]